MKNIAAIVSLLVLFSFTAFPQVGIVLFSPSYLTETYVSPGLKMGYRFGKRSEVTIGVELSVARWNKSFYSGWAAGIDYCFRKTGDNSVSIRAEVQGGPTVFGISTGPVLMMTGSTIDPGWTATAWTLLFVMPYAGFTYTSTFRLENEAGLFLKAPHERW
jgi:hypothetical protein